jgi:hypothetical protein
LEIIVVTLYGLLKNSVEMKKKVNENARRTAKTT